MTRADVAVTSVSDGAGVVSAGPEAELEEEPEGAGSGMELKFADSELDNPVDNKMELVTESGDESDASDELVLIRKDDSESGAEEINETEPLVEGGGAVETLGPSLVASEAEDAVDVEPAVPLGTVTVLPRALGEEAVGRRLDESVSTLVLVYGAELPRIIVLLPSGTNDELDIVVKGGSGPTK